MPYALALVAASARALFVKTSTISRLYWALARMSEMGLHSFDACFPACSKVSLVSSLPSKCFSVFFPRIGTGATAPIATLASLHMLPSMTNMAATQAAEISTLLLGEIC